MTDAVAPQTPETMRRRLRLALKGAREAAKLTQREAAQPLEWSVSKIIRIEKGLVGISTTDLKALLEVYDITDEAEVNKLLELARGSRKQSWSEYREVYLPTSLTLFGSEGAASKIKKYEPTFIPGLFQTEEYARALLIGLGHSSERVDAMVRARMERQELLDRDTRPDLQFIIGEAALSRRVGNSGVMRHQLRHIRELSGLPGIEVQVLNLDAGAHPKMGGAFTILEFADPNLDELLYLEDASGEKLTREDAPLVAEYLEAFDDLQRIALPVKESESRLDEIAASKFAVDPRKTPYKK